MDIIKALAAELSVRESQIQAAVTLIDDGCTIPFIARYRKEMTGGLNDEVLRSLDERLKYLRSLEEKKEQIIRSIEEQGKMNPELLSKIREADTLVRLEDLYRPYRPKRRTRAMIAEEKGLAPLAHIILQQKTGRPLVEEAARFVDPAREVNSPEEAIAGARDIIAEAVSDSASFRSLVRRMTFDQGQIVSRAKDPEAESVYEKYYDYSETCRSIPGHRLLALNRGEKEKFLTVSVEAPADSIISQLEKRLIRSSNPNTTPALKEAAADGYKRLIAPSVEREIRNQLTETAEASAIKVFGQNLKQLLMQPPIAGQTVLGWDPAFRTGCKLAVVDPTGKVLDTTVIYPTAPQNKVSEARKVLSRLIDRYQVSLISVGNGTASRESEQIIADYLKEERRPVRYVIVSEAGASVYSASKLATEEFPNFDVGQRSAASIARRLQDPLAELVKIDPKSIGVGQYQHDMNQKKLGEALSSVVEDCVNSVGVDLNTASAALLENVSGISKTLARNIVVYRDENGAFVSRRDLLKVPKLGPKAYEQCAGFLRITDGKEPLDGTSVHPESYKAARELIRLLGYTPEDLKNRRIHGIRSRVKDRGAMAETLSIGEPTLNDILDELEKPGRDPREDMPKPVLRTDVLSMEDLKPGMVLKGTVRNVIDFGAFVDIGVHQDGLVHISQICDHYIRHPLDAVSVGDIVEVTVLGVDLKKKRISLSMRSHPLL